MKYILTILLFIVLLPQMVFGVTAAGWNTPTPTTGWVLPNAINGTNQVIDAVNGLFSTASSTFSSTFFLPSLSQGFSYIGSAGKLNTIATSSISLSGFNNDLASLTATNGSLTFTGSYNGSAARTVGLNLGNTNTWTILQNFNYSSSTIYSSFLTASSTFLNAGSFTLATTSAGCASITNVGLLFSTGVACGSGGSFTNTIANGGTGSTSFAPNSIITSNAAGTALIATTSTLYVTNLFATSTTATSTFMGNISLTDGTNYGFVTGAQPLILSGTINLPYQSIISNKSTGSTAMSGYTLANANTVNNANPFLDTYYGGMYMAGSAFALYPGLQPNDLVVVNSDAQVSIASLSSTTGAINFAVNAGFTAANWDARLLGLPSNGTASFVVGTTTGAGYTGILNSTTTSQLSLANGAGISQWTFRNAGGNFYVSTTTVAGTATSSVAALRIDTNGKVIANCFSTDGSTCLSGTGGAGTVTSVGITSTNSTLTFGSTPITTSGTFTADLNLGHANTWTAAQTFSGGLMVATTTQWMNSIATLVGTTTIQGQINSIFASTTGSATQTINWSSGNTQRIIINASTNIVMNATSSNPIDGGKYVLKICQDPVGSRAITFVTPGQLRWWNGTTTISTAASTCTFIGMIYDDLYQKYSIIASSTGVTLF